jgi:hypothetical protein
MSCALAGACGGSDNIPDMLHNGVSAGEGEGAAGESNTDTAGSQSQGSAGRSGSGAAAGSKATAGAGGSAGKAGSSGAAGKASAGSGAGGAGGKGAAGGKGGAGGSPVGGRSGNGGITAAGSGGSGGSHAAGTGGTSNSAGTGGSTGGGESAACVACQAKQTVCAMRHSACVDATKTVAMGTRAGASQGALCKETLGCMYSSGCAVPLAIVPPGEAWAGPLACYCGSVTDPDECAQLATPAGKCADIISAGAETSMPGDVTTRLNDGDYAVGNAFRSVQCAQRFCPKSCGLCAAGDTACQDMTSETAGSGGTSESGTGGSSGASGQG